MRIVVNGETRDLSEGSSVRDLLTVLGLGDALVAVERNTQLVPRREHATAVLSDGDVLEVVNFVGGG